MAKELTILQVRDGIIQALDAAYPNASIFSDPAPQKVEDGSFNVVFVNATEREKLGEFRKHSVTFDIVYYAARNDLTDSMLAVATDLPLLLETITTSSGAKVHPEGEVMPTPQDDDTLHCVVTYSYRVTAKRVHVDDHGNETPYDAHGNLDETDLMRHLHLHLHEEEQ